MSEFSDFTKLVLDRMETNPDEFEANARWDTLVRGLEAHAIGDFDNRYAKTLWALEPLEIEAIMAKYRKLYLARIHKELLKNIVSGDDLHRTQYAYDSGNDVNPLKPMTGSTLRGATGSVMTTAAMKSTMLSTLGQEFDKAYTDAFTNAVAKAEGTQIAMSNSTHSGSSK